MNSSLAVKGLNTTKTNKNTNMTGNKFLFHIFHVVLKSVVESLDLSIKYLAIKVQVGSDSTLVDSLVS